MEGGGTVGWWVRDGVVGNEGGGANWREERVVWVVRVAEGGVVGGGRRGEGEGGGEREGGG